MTALAHALTLPTKLPRKAVISDDLADLARFYTLPTYAIGLLKGERWEGNEGHGIVHRSPRLTPQAPRRLLLTLDFWGSVLCGSN